MLSMILGWLAVILVVINFTNLFFYGTKDTEPTIKCKFMNEFADSKYHVLFGILAAVLIIMHTILSFGQSDNMIVSWLSFITTFLAVGVVFGKGYLKNKLDFAKLHASLVIVAIFSIVLHVFLG